MITNKDVINILVHGADTNEGKFLLQAGALQHLEKLHAATLAERLQFVGPDSNPEQVLRALCQIQAKTDLLESLIALHYRNANQQS